MATVTLKGSPIQTSGSLPRVGSQAPEFKLVKGDLSEVSLADFKGQKKIINIFPSIDTGTCALSVRTFNEKASALPDVTILNISADLPFAQQRFCGAEGIEKVGVYSSFRSSFAKDWGLEITDGPLMGLCSRVILVLDENDKVLHAEQVGEIVDEPNYEAAIAALTI